MLTAPIEPIITQTGLKRISIRRVEANRIRPAEAALRSKAAGENCCPYWTAIAQCPGQLEAWTLARGDPGRPRMKAQDRSWRAYGRRGNGAAMASRPHCCYDSDGRFARS